MLIPKKVKSGSENWSALARILMLQFLLPDKTQEV